MIKEIFIKVGSAVLVLTPEELQQLPKETIEAGIARAKCYRGEDDNKNPWNQCET